MGKNDISAINIPDFMHQECCHISSCEESPTPVWLNNSLSLYCTVTHCVTYSLDPSHLLTYISTEFGCMATYDLNSLAPSFTQYEYCNDFGSSKVECVSQLPNMYGTQLCLLQSPAIPQECAPWHSEGYFSGVMWHEWMNLVARVTTTLAVRSCRQFIAKNPLKVLSSWWFTACVGVFAKSRLIFPENVWSTIASSSGISALWYKEENLTSLKVKGHFVGFFFLIYDFKTFPVLSFSVIMLTLYSWVQTLPSLLFSQCNSILVCTISSKVRR